MKKLLLLLSFIFTATVYAQDLEYQTKLKEGVTTEKEAVDLTASIVDLAKKPLRFHSAREHENKYFVVQYIPTNVTDENWKSNRDEYSSEAVVFKFRISNKGENKNLEIPGVKTYVFNDVYGKYLNLFPFWQKYFDATSDLEKLSTESFTQKNKYTFSGNNGSWIIR